MHGKESSYKSSEMCGEAEAVCLNCFSIKFVNEGEEEEGETTYLPTDGKKPS